MYIVIFIYKWFILIGKILNLFHSQHKKRIDEGCYR